MHIPDLGRFIGQSWQIKIIHKTGEKTERSMVISPGTLIYFVQLLLQQVVLFVVACRILECR